MFNFGSLIVRTIFGEYKLICNEGTGIALGIYSGPDILIVTNDPNKATPQIPYDLDIKAGQTIWFIERRQYLNGGVWKECTVISIREHASIF